MHTDREKAHFFFDLGACTFHLTPVTIFKCSLAGERRVRGNRKELLQYTRFRDCFLPFLLSIGNNYDPHFFAMAAQERIDSIVRRESLDSPLVNSHVRHIMGILDSDLYLQKVHALALKYGEAILKWFRKEDPILIQKSMEYMQSYGVSPMLHVLGTVGNLGAGIAGQYQPSLHTVAVQLDAIEGRENPTISFLDVILHEQVHALINQNLSYDPSRCELRWLHELAAITTSHEAICQAGKDLQQKKEIERACRALRKRQRYGKLAQSVIDCMPDRLIAWKIWQDIFSLPVEMKKHYAEKKVLAPILWERGWKSTLPISYGRRMA